MAESSPLQTTTTLDNQQLPVITPPSTSHFSERLRRGIVGIGSSLADLVYLN